MDDYKLRTELDKGVIDIALYGRSFYVQGMNKKTGRLETKHIPFKDVTIKGDPQPEGHKNCV